MSQRLLQSGRCLSLLIEAYRMVFVNKEMVVL